LRKLYRKQFKEFQGLLFSDFPIQFMSLFPISPTYGRPYPALDFIPVISGENYKLSSFSLWLFRLYGTTGVARILGARSE